MYVSAFRSVLNTYMCTAILLSYATKCFYFTSWMIATIMFTNPKDKYIYNQQYVLLYTDRTMIL